MTHPALLDTKGIIFVFLYLFSLILVGIIGHLSKKENTMGVFYLAGRNMSGIVLFLTL